MGSDPGWLTGQIPTAGQWNGAFAAKRDDLAYAYVRPLTGASLVAEVNQGSFVVDPLGEIAALSVMLPPAPIDGQLFDVSTTQTIDALTALAPVGASITGGGPFVLGANGGVAWRYVLANLTWYRRY